MISNNILFCQQAKVIDQIGQAKEDIIVAVERALVLLYGGAKEEGLDVLRYRRSVKRFLKTHRMWNHVLCHRPQRLQCTTAIESTIM